MNKEGIDKKNMIEQNASFIQNDVSDIYVGKIEREE